ncbi:phosphoenolpyruvate-utilizing N-terminal domain-containing protein [Nocardioides salsibiostraticola]
MLTHETRTLRGTPVVPGIAYAPALVARMEVSPDAVERFRQTDFSDPEEAIAAYDASVTRVADGFASRGENASGAAAEVLAASAGLARDKGLRGAVVAGLSERPCAGRNLLNALHDAIEQFAAVFSSMGGLMAERVTDLRDIERRIVAHLVGEPEPGAPAPSERSIILAEDLAPSDTAGLDPSRVAALLTQRGGPTSHTAIIARQLGIPCVVGVTDLLTVEAGTPLLVDGTAGTIEINVEPTTAESLVAADRERAERLSTWAGPGATADGVAVKLLANVADGASAVQSAESPVEGVGLFRTELCFLDRTEEPTPDEQADIYAKALAPFASTYVVVRTLDAGSDKPVAFATHGLEENPALGVRGLRLSFDNPGLLDRQLDAIASAAEQTGTTAWVMAPMVATVSEATEFADKVRSRGLKPGVMVEIPSAVLMAPQILEVVDFLSIGTNDLTQYTMAADRMATDLAHLTDPWQPAVLRLIEMTAKAGQAVDKPVGVCGEAAADPLLACVLVGLGITSLSMAAAAVRPVGAQLATVTSAQCVELARAAVDAAGPTQARAAVLELLS